MIKVNDKIKTPRFLTVRISEIFETVEEARQNGYYEPTYYLDDSITVLGKSIGVNRMVFAAAYK